MQRPVSMRHPGRSACRPRTLRRAAAGFTLVEVLVTTVLALILLGTVTAMLGRVGEGVADSRAMLEMADRLRLAQVRLQMDLAGATVTMAPPRDPANGEGYFEYIEGPITAGTASAGVAKNIDNGDCDDSTVGDFDDVLMFTTRSADRPFAGRSLSSGNRVVIQSTVAEVAWFLRGRTLHRRVLLVAPGVNLSAVTSPWDFYENYDISARWNSATSKMVANTLGDLTRRECRFAHPASSYPYDVRNWCWTRSGYTFPTLPTLYECSTSTWSPEAAGGTATLSSTLDFWTNVSGHRAEDNCFASGSRVTDDVILTNVIGFDVKAWDPTAVTTSGTGTYVDLGYNVLAGTNTLGHYGDSLSQLTGSATKARVYDTYSTSYEASNGLIANGLDDDNNGIVDDDGEKVYAPPYSIPLRGVQVKIRVFEPDTKQIREVTVVQEFLP